MKSSHPVRAPIAPFALLVTAALASSVALAAGNQAPGAGPAQLPAEAVARGLALATEAAGAMAPPQARVQVEAGNLDARLTLAPCAHVEAFLPAGVPAWGRTQVGLRCTQGPVSWRVFLPVQVQVWAPGVVGLAALPAGARLSASQLGTASVDWGLPGGAFEEMTRLEGRVLSRPLLPGQTLRPGDLQPREWFALGETVQIVVEGAGFSVTSEGQAITRGLEGQLARVRTEGGRVVVGRAVGDHRLEVPM